MKQICIYLQKFIQGNNDARVECIEQISVHEGALYQFITLEWSGRITSIDEILPCDGVDMEDDSVHQFLVKLAEAAGQGRRTHALEAWRWPTTTTSGLPPSLMVFVT